MPRNPKALPHSNCSSQPKAPLSQSSLHKQQLLKNKQEENKEKINILELLLKAIEKETSPADEHVKIEVAKQILKFKSALAALGVNFPPIHMNSAVKAPASTRLTNLQDLEKKHERFIKMQEKSIFYDGSGFSNAMETFNKVATTLLDEIVASVEKDFAAGIELFVQDFLIKETTI